nr:DUF1043 family protein [Zoogloeaceae bacterium]
MTVLELWVVVVMVAVIAGVIGFFAGRQTAGSKERVDELEAALGREKAALADYRDKVDAHFDKTAGLFVSMAGSYKDLFEHLSAGYEHLAPDASRALFKDKVSALLLESRAPEAMPVEPVAGGVIGEAATVAAAAAAAVAPEPETQSGRPDQPAGAATDTVPAAAETSGLTLDKAPPAAEVGVVPAATVAVDGPAGIATASPPPSQPEAPAQSSEPAPAAEESKKPAP